MDTVLKSTVCEKLQVPFVVTHLSVWNVFCWFPWGSGEMQSQPHSDSICWFNPPVQSLNAEHQAGRHWVQNWLLTMTPVWIWIRIGQWLLQSVWSIDVWMLNKKIKKYKETLIYAEHRSPAGVLRTGRFWLTNDETRITQANGSMCGSLNCSPRQTKRTTTTKKVINLLLLRCYFQMLWQMVL